MIYHHMISLYELHVLYTGRSENSIIVF